VILVKCFAGELGLEGVEGVTVYHRGERLEYFIEPGARFGGK
jgi:hypothetical protein